MGRYLEDLHPGASQLYSDTQNFVGKCFTLKYRSNSSTSIINGFDDIFRGHVEAVVLEENSKLTESGLIDSVLVKINQESPKVKSPVYLGHSTFSFDCVTKATKADYDPLSDFKKCTQTKHVLKFKAEEGFVQEIMMNKDGENEVKPQQKLNHTNLIFSDYQTITSDQFVRMPGEPGAIPDTKFDTIWSMIITLEPTVQKRKEIWLVQDDSENRTSTIVNLLERDDEENESDEGRESQGFDWFINLIAWAGGLWFFFVHMVIGPLIKWRVQSTQPERVRNIGNELFYGKSPTQDQLQERKSIVADEVIIEEFELAEEEDAKKIN